MPSDADRERNPYGARRRRVTPVLLVPLLLALLGTACGNGEGTGTGTGTDPGGQGGGGGDGGNELLPFEPASGGVRRLLARQYVNSVRALLGDAAADAVLESDVLPEAAPISGYAAIGAARTPPALHHPASWDTAAERAASALVTDPSTLGTHVPCISSQPQPDCYEQLAEGLGRLAFRRPVTDEEKAWMVDLASEGEELDGDFMTGVKYAVWGILSSPNFLYMVEIGEPDPEREGWNQLTGYELATRLSFFLTDTTPDAELLAAAESGDLGTPEGLAAAALELLGRDAARETLWAHFRERFEIERVLSTEKDETLFPDFTSSATLRDALVEEVRLVVDDIAWERDVDARELFTSRETFMNAELAKHYDLPAPSSEWEKVSIPSFRDASGLLTSGAFLAGASSPTSSSPSRRGAAIRERILCLEVPPPSPEMHPDLPGPDPGAEPGDPTRTTRGTLEELTSESTCQDCHALFDPVGFAFEHFDAVGRHRDEENDTPIDASGSLPALGSWDDASELGERLAEADETARCFVVQLVRGGLGHVETPEEEAAIAELAESFAADGYRLRPLLVEMTSSQLFRYVKTPDAD